MGKNNCDKCGTPLSPAEGPVDLGDGLENICDGCLGVSN